MVRKLIERRIAAVAAFAALLFVPGMVQAQAQEVLSVNEVFGTFGIATATASDHGSCRVTTTLDKNTFLTKVPILQKLGLLNQDLTQSDVNAKPTQLAMAFTMQMTPVITRAAFEKDTSANICSFVVDLKEANVYGHMVNNNVLSYTFDRATFAKIDWDQFEAINIMKVARQFSLNREMMARVQIEAQR